MKVLFISRAKHKNKISPIILNQGNSLKRNDIELDYFAFEGNGFLAYFPQIFKLKKQIRTKQYHVYHAHYSISGIAATFANAKPLVVSLMGSDVLSNIFSNNLSGFFSKYFWNRTIVKSPEMKNTLGLKEIEIIPNGVDLDYFKPLDKKECQLKLKWPNDKIHILFAGDPDQKVKNFDLANKAIKSISQTTIRMHVLKNIPHDKLQLYYNASDVSLLSSKKEGSPNVIKEAMACNCPIVTTDVGDVRKVIGNTAGCFVTSFDPHDIANSIKEALKFAEKEGRTSGYKRIIDQGLDSNSIANRLIEVYKQTLTNYKN